MTRKQLSAPAPTWIWLTLAAGAVVRGILLTAQGFWHDEAVSLLTASQPGWWATFVFAMRVQFGAPLYYLALHGWLAFGTGEAAVRLLSVLGGIAALWSALSLARETMPPGVAPAAGWLLALQPIAIAYAQEARGYSWLMFLDLEAARMVWRAVTGSAAPWRLRYAACLGLGALIHPGVWLWWPAGATVVLASRRWRTLVPQLAAATGPAALVTGTGWLAAHAVWQERLAAPFHIPPAGVYAGQAAVLCTVGHYAGATALAVLPWLVAGLGVAAVISAWRRPADRLAHEFIAAHAVLPILAVWAGIVTGASSQLRYVLACAPLVILLAMAGAASLPRGWRAVAVALMLAGGAQGWGRSWRTTPTLEPTFVLHSRKPVREAAALVVREFSQGDRIVHLSTASLLPMRWYAPRLPQGYVIPNWDLTPSFTGPVIGPPVALAAAVRGARRIWLISCPWRYADPPVIPDQYRRVLDRWCEAPLRYSFQGLDVYLAVVRTTTAR